MKRGRAELKQQKNRRGKSRPLSRANGKMRHARRHWVRAAMTGRSGKTRTEIKILLKTRKVTSCPSFLKNKVDRVIAQKWVVRGNALALLVYLFPTKSTGKHGVPGSRPFLRVPELFSSARSFVCSLFFLRYFARLVHFILVPGETSL